MFNVKYKFNSNICSKIILVDILKRVYKTLMAITYWKTFLHYTERLTCIGELKIGYDNINIDDRR